MALQSKEKYIKNKDLLRAIHFSKNTYSSFATDEDSEYDLILDDISQINIRSIANAKRSRSVRLAKINHEEAQVSGGKKLPAKTFEIDYRKILKTDVVFRIMTYDHIPDAPGRKKVIKSEADKHVVVNFPPFQHWKFTAEGQLVCVGKSHWKGDLDTGDFSISHGKMTDSLARMFLKLCERCSTKYNVRSYTYNDEMRGQAILQLTQIALKFDESKSDNPFAYYTAAVNNSFVRIINIEKRNQNIRDGILEMNGMNPSSTRQNSESYGNRIVETHFDYE